MRSSLISIFYLFRLTHFSLLSGFLGVGLTGADTAGSEVVDSSGVGFLAAPLFAAAGLLSSFSCFPEAVSFKLGFQLQIILMPLTYTSRNAPIKPPDFLGSRLFYSK